MLRHDAAKNPQILNGQALIAFRHFVYINSFPASMVRVAQFLGSSVATQAAWFLLRPRH